MARHNQKRPPKGTGQPDPSKDRSAHEAARGQAKRSLRDLSNVMVLDPYIQDILHELDNQSDRGAALIAASMLDITLRWLIQCRLATFPDCAKILFLDEGAPMGSFASRIKMARALGCIGQLSYDHLTSIRLIRNQFAHSPLKIDFTNEAISDEIEKLLPDNPEWKPEWSAQRRRYIGTIITLAQAFDAATKLHFEDTVPLWLN